MSSYPALDKLAAVSDRHAAILEFLEYHEGKGRTLGEWTASGNYLEPCLVPRVELLADFFDLDLAAIERERRRLLDGVQAVSAAAQEGGTP